MENETDKFINPYLIFGVDFHDSCGTERIGTCPFCGKLKHFYVNSENGKFSCKGGSCGIEGGISTFLESIYKLCKEYTTKTQLQNLGTKRNLPIRILNNFGVVVNYVNTNEYLIPIYTDYLHDLKRYDISESKAKLKPIPTRGLQIFNLKDLRDRNKLDWPVFICEGEWDAMSLYWLFEKTNTKAIVVGIPGARTFKNDWSNYFCDRFVYIVYDNDEAGDAGQLKLDKNLTGVAKRLQFLNWPHEMKSGYDISDFVRDQVTDRSGFELCVTKLKVLMSDRPRIEVADIKEDIDPSKIKEADVDPKLVPSLQELMHEYDDVLNRDMNEEIRQLIKIMLATIISINFPGNDPVWMFIVGPPGCGKTTLLLTLTVSPRTFFQSTLSSASLISGYQKPNMPDPSIIPKLNGKCLVLKDYTEIFSKPEMEREAVLGIMRGAYDGSAERNYGQGVVRRYISKFSFLAGVTKAIYGHDQTAMGERSLRYVMDSTGINMDKQQAAAMDLSIFGSKKMETIRQHVAYFLTKQFDFSPENLVKMKPDWFEHRIINLARLTAIVRTGVSRHENFNRNAGEPIYDPESEDPKRLTVQLQKMALSLALLTGETQVSENIYRIVKRIAIDTMYGRQFVLLKILMQATKPLPVEDIQQHIKLSKEGIKNFLEDMVLLGLIKTKLLPGKITYLPAPIIAELWSKSCLG